MTFIQTLCLVTGEQVLYVKVHLLYYDYVVSTLGIFFGLFPDNDSVLNKNLKKDKEKHLHLV